MAIIIATGTELPVPNRLSTADWAARIAEIDEHSFFATPTWGSVLEGSGLGYRSYALELEANGVRALLPVAEQRLGPFRLRESMPFGTYGGMLPLNPAGSYDERRAGESMLAQLNRQFKRGPLFVTAGPHRHLAFAAPAESHRTSIIDLTVGSDVLWARFEKDARNQVRQAERAGVAVTADMSLQAFRDYYAMLEETARRWGGSARPKPWSLFESIARHAAEPQAGIKLWLAHVDGALAAGALCFYGRGEVFQWSGAMKMEMNRQRPNNAIQWAVIRAAADSGYTSYNMGASAGLPNVEAFKKQFGAVNVEYPVYVLGGGLYKLARKAAVAFRLRRRGPVAKSKLAKGVAAGPSLSSGSMTNKHWGPRAGLPDLRGVLDPADMVGRKNGHIDAIHKLALSTYARVPKGAAVLDFGCGVGRMGEFLARRASTVIGLDASSEMIDAASAREHSSRIRYILAQAGAPIPLDDGGIDYILTIGVLQHILEAQALDAVLHEFRRVLSPGGTVAIIEQVQSVAHEEAEFKIQRTPSDYVSAFQRAGFAGRQVVSIRIPSPITNWVGSGRITGPAARAAVAADMLAAHVVRRAGVYRDALMIFGKVSS